MRMEFGPTTSISLGGTDLTPYIARDKPIIMHAVEHAVEHGDSFRGGFVMRPIRLRLKARATPEFYRLLLGRTHPRIRRMHAAYGRKKGWGKR